MEWLEGAEEISDTNITLPQAHCLVVGLQRIHDLELIHNDLQFSNIVVIPGTDRGVVLDFSCARLGNDEEIEGEMGIGASVVMGMVPLYIASLTVAHE